MHRQLRLSLCSLLSKFAYKSEECLKTGPSELKCNGIISTAFCDIIIFYKGRKKTERWILKFCRLFFLVLLRLRVLLYGEIKRYKRSSRIRTVKETYFINLLFDITSTLSVFL